MSENLAENHSCSSVQSVGEKTPKVSVIVPVYKVEKYLPECIESVLAQTFTDFELILVDDGSPDNSGKICDDYALRDSRIRVFHKENGGVSSARNLGLDNARGEWICFFDADDWVEHGMVEELIRAKNDLVICNFKYYKEFRRGRVSLEEKKVPSFSFLSVSDAYVKLYDLGLINSPCNKLFRREITERNQIRFPESIGLGEDTVFVTRYFQCISGVSVVNQGLYIVRRCGGSAISRYQKSFFKSFKIKLQELRKIPGISRREYFRVASKMFWGVPFELVKHDCPEGFSSKLGIIKEALSLMPLPLPSREIRGTLLRVGSPLIIYFYSRLFVFLWETKCFLVGRKV